jgi:hypothetical protein
MMNTPLQKLGVILWAIVVGIFLGAFLACPAHSSVPQCKLGLLLAIDVSASLDGDEQVLIREGTAAALIDPEVIYAATRGDPIMVQVFQWAEKQQVVVDWRRIASAEDMHAFAADIAAAPPSSSLGTGTHMGDAIAAAHAQFDAIPGGCQRQVVDLFTDGEVGGGIPIQAGLAEFEDGRDELNVIYLGDNAAAMDRVIFGYGSFVMPVPGIREFQRAMVRKLLREIS